MLALIGSGEYLPPIEPVDRYLLEHLPTSPRVICLPTAAGTEGDERIRYWMDLGVRYFRRLGVLVQAIPVIDRSSANNPVFAEQILQANFVYMSGGQPGYLFRTLKDSLVWQAIMEIIEKGGLLAGCSAGAMIMGERIPAFPLWRKAFSLLPGVAIAPHFDEIPTSAIKFFKLLTGKRIRIIGIEANTALFVNQSHLKVIGAGSVTIINQKNKTRYIAGESIPRD